MRTDRGSYLWLAPAAAGIAFLAAAPLAQTAWMSLHRRFPVFGVDEWVGLDNYLFLLRNPRFLHSLGVTLYFSAVSVSIELILGLALALLLWEDFAGHAALLGLFLIPWIVPGAVAAKMWEWIFNPKFGLLNHVLVAAGLLSRPAVWLGSPFWAIHAAILADVWKTAPFMALLLLAGLRSIPAELYKAAQIDGASAAEAFRRVTLPCLRPMIVVALLFRTLDAFRVFDIIYVLTGGGPANTTETVSIYAYKVFFQTLDFGYGSAVSFAVFLGAAALCGGFLLAMREAR